MNPLARFERLATRLFEEDLPRLLGGRIDPAELTRVVDRAIGEVPGNDAPPAALQVELGPADYAALEARRPAIEAELSRYAAHRIAERWPGNRVRPVVRIVVEEGRGRRAAQAEPMAPRDATAALTRALPVQPSAAPVAQAVLWNGVQALPVEHLPVAIGRALDNDVVLDHPSVSRYHAQIRGTAKRLVAVDIGSTNGTWVNDRRVAGPIRLRDGDTLVVGQWPLRLALGRNAAT